MGALDCLEVAIICGNEISSTNISSSLFVNLSTEACPVTTRQQARRAEEALNDRTQVSPNSPNPDQTVLPLTWAIPTDFTRELLSDPTLSSYRERAGRIRNWTDRVGLGITYIGWPKRRDLILCQLVPLQKYQRDLLSIGEYIPLRGHFRVSKTLHHLTLAILLAKDNRGH